MTYLMGIDSGLTVTKAVVFDEEGRELGKGSVQNAQRSPRPRWVEQDMDRLWEGCEGAIREAIDASGVDPAEIGAVGVAGHGDGIYPVDPQGRPVRAGILSLDSRAHEVLARWDAEGVSDGALRYNGQKPFAALPPTLLKWMSEYEPGSLERTGQVLYVKDWLRFKLTGEYATDPTEASSGFTEVETQDYSDEAYDVYGLPEVRGKLPPIVGSAEVAGKVTGEAARATGLREGTAVVTGAHDVDCSAIGSGCIRPGQLTMVAGTWSINEIISDRPVLGDGWAARNFVSPGLYMNMSASPASATNLEWFVTRLCALDVEEAEREGRSPFGFVNEEVEAVLEEDSHVFYHPFLYGSPLGDAATGGFYGLRGWHTRGHLLKALFEGTVFNHRSHVDTLRTSFEVSQARLTGGGSRSPIWSQMFADALDLTVEVTDAGEAGALGAAICAGIGTGVYGSLEDATARTVRLLRTHEPDPGRHARLSEAYETYNALADALTPVWPRLG